MKNSQISPDISMGTKGKRGVAMTEFVIVIPLVLVMMLLTMEFSFMMIEKHFLTSGVYSAARMAVKTIQELPPPPERAPDYFKHPLRVAEEKDCPKDLKEKMHRKIVFKLAAVSPTVTSLIAKLGLPAMDLPFKGSFGRLTRVANGYVSAYLLTSITACKIKKNGVEVTSRYFRSGKFPFAGNVVWSMWVINHFFNRILNKASVGGKNLLYATLDENFFGIRLSSPLVGGIADKVRKKLKDIAEKVKKLQDLNLGADKIQGFLGEELASWFRADTYIGGVVEAVTDKINNAIFSLDMAMASFNQKINSQSALLTTVLYMVPEFLRVIPLNQTVFLAWESQNIRNVNNNPWSGMNLLIAPYQGNADGDNFSLWEKWIKHLVSYNPDWKSKREYLAAP